MYVTGNIHSYIRAYLHTYTFVCRHRVGMQVQPLFVAYIQQSIHSYFGLRVALIKSQVGQAQSSPLTNVHGRDNASLPVNVHSAPRVSYPVRPIIIIIINIIAFLCRFTAGAAIMAYVVCTTNFPSTNEFRSPATYRSTAVKRCRPQSPDGQASYSNLILALN